MRNPPSGTYDMKEWTKAFLSQPEEFDYLISEDDIDGELPADLCGTLFRNRPGLFERGTSGLTASHDCELRHCQSINQSSIL